MPKRRVAASPKSDAEIFHVTDWPMHYLLAIVRTHSQNIDTVLKSFQCSAPAWRVLSNLAEQDGHSVNDLAELSVMERSNLSKLLESMEKDGLIERRAPDDDKRKVAVFLTPPGRQLFDESLPLVLRYYAEFLSGISRSEMTVFMDVLRKIKSNIRSFDTREVLRGL